MDLIAIQAFLDRGIIQVKEKETTVFDIAGFPHYENVVSNIYAYFFDPNKEHGLGSLFLDSLQELINTDFRFTSPEVLREKTTKKGGRIDLVIQDADKQDKKVILIENKVYHWVHNDLDDYYNSYKALKMKGVLLSVSPIKTGHKEFVNITHDQLLNKVFANLGLLLLSVPEQSLYLLKEFSKNLKNFVMSHEIRSYYEFYQRNYSAIGQVQKLQSTLEEHVWSQIGRVPELLKGMGLKLGGTSSSRLRYFLTTKTEHVYFTVFPHVLDKREPSIHLVVELQKKGVKLVEKINEIEFTSEERGVLQEITAVRPHWLHFASQSFTLSNEDVEELGEFIKNKIEISPLKSIFSKVEAFLAQSEVLQKESPATV